MCKKAGTALIIAGALLLFSAAGLFIYNEVQSSRAEEAAQSALNALEQEISENSGSFDYSPEMKTVNIDGYDYIGYLTVPCANINLPVMAEWDDVRMNISPCLYYGSFKSDNMVIVGHSYKGVFRALREKVKEGDEVYFTDVENNTYRYTVGVIEILQPTDTQKMIESEFELSIYTCTYGARERFTVRCKKI